MMYFLSSHKSHTKKYRLKNIKEIYINMTTHRDIFSSYTTSRENLRI